VALSESDMQMSAIRREDSYCFRDTKTGTGKGILDRFWGPEFIPAGGLGTWYLFSFHYKIIRQK
jgi:hypothetical protein